MVRGALVYLDTDRGRRSSRPTSCGRGSSRARVVPQTFANDAVLRGLEFRRGDKGPRRAGRLAFGLEATNRAGAMRLIDPVRCRATSNPGDRLRWVRAGTRDRLTVSNLVMSTTRA